MSAFQKLWEVSEEARASGLIKSWSLYSPSNHPTCLQQGLKTWFPDDDKWQWTDGDLFAVGFSLDELLRNVKECIAEIKQMELDAECEARSS